MSTTSPDDPFAALDNGRTFIMPTPGGRGAGLNQAERVRGLPQLSWAVRQLCVNSVCRVT